MPFGSSVDTNDRLPFLGLTAGALDADLVPEMDISAWPWLSLNVTNGVYDGTLTMQGTETPSDAASWTNVFLYRLADRFGSTDNLNGTSNIALGGNRVFSWFRCRMTAYVSGIATANLYLLRDGLPGFQMAAFSATILNGFAYFGAVRNDGGIGQAVAAGTAADTTIQSAGGIIGSILVTASGTNTMLIYDNTAASGAVVAIVPSNAPTGTIIKCQAICGTGVTIKGNGSNPGITIFATQTA